MDEKPAKAVTKASLGEFFKKAPTGVRVKLICLGCLAALVTGTSFWAIAELVSLQWKGTRKPAAVVSPVPAPEVTYGYELGLLSLALSDRDRSRSAHAQFTIVLEMADQDSRRVMELNRARLIDRVLEVGSRFSIEDLEGAEGLLKFKRLLTEELKKEFGESGPVALSFKDWVLN